MKKQSTHKYLMDSLTTNIRSHGKSIKPRDYQVDAVEYAIRKHRALLLSPTAQVNR